MINVCRLYLNLNLNLLCHRGNLCFILPKIMSIRQLALIITSFLLTVLDCGFSVDVTSENFNNYFTTETRVAFFTFIQHRLWPPSDIILNIGISGIYNTDDGIETISEDAFTNVAPVDKMKLYGCYQLIKLPDSLLQSSGFQRLKMITFMHNGFETLPGNIFRGLTELQALSLDSNQLKVIPPNLFSSNSALKCINLNNNWLTSLPAELFANNPALEVIDLCLNKLKLLSPHLFASNTALKRILIQFNRLTSISSRQFVNNAALVTIDLSNNKLTSLDPQLFANNIDISHIILTGNRLTSLHSQLFVRQKFVNTIDLSGNNLSLLSPRLFERNTDLAYVYVSHNKIKSLSAKLFSNIRSFSHSIYLNNNDLEELPDGVFVSRISGINLAHNKLTFIQATVFQHNGEKLFIDYLDVSNNYLLCLSSFLINVREIKLDWNCFDYYKSSICRVHDCRFQKPSKCTSEMKMKINVQACTKLINFI